MTLLHSLARLYGAIQCLYILSPFCPTISAGVIQTNQNYYYVGENITLHCYADSKFVDLRFSYGNDIEVPTEYVTVLNDTYARMDRPAMAEDYAKTTYVCWSNFEEANEVDTQPVETEYRPQKVTNLTCINDNMQDAQCTWNLAAQYKNNYFVNVATHWRATPEESWQYCTTSTKTSCNIINYTQPVLYIRVNVTNTRRRDSVTTEFPVIIMKKDEKPAPLSKLTVRRLNASCALLTWSLDIAGLTYSISKSSDVIDLISNEVNTTGDNTTICNLSLFQKYTFRVQAFPQKGFPSEPVTAILNEQDGLSSEEVSGTYYIGEKITLHCHSFENFTRGTFVYGSDIEVPSNFVTIVNATYIRLDMPVDKPILPTVYYCLDKKNNSTTFVGSEQIQTEYRPQNVTNVTCVYLNRRSLNCSWSLGPNLYRHPAVSDSHSSYLTSVTPHWSSDNRQWKACINTSLTSCDIGRYNSIHVSLRVNVTNISRRESAVIELSNLRVNDFVKPSPVEELAVASLSSTCTSLTWRGKMAKLSYSVSYSSPHFPDDGNNFTTQNQGITVCRLHPFRNYTFQVRAIPEKGFSSEPSTQLLQTEEDVPATGPQVTMGGYYREPCSSGDQDVFIYFQPVPEEERNGNIINYSVAVMDGKNRTKEYVFNNSENSFSFNITVPCNQGFNASLYANTLVGSSPPSIVSVPAVNKVHIMEAIDFAIQKNAGASKTALWNPPEDSRVNTVFVYYCKSLPKPSKHCKTPMQHVVANASAVKQMLNSSDADIFGISLVSDDNVTTGIHFTSCIFTLGCEAVKKPVKPDIKTLSMTTVRVKLEYKYCDNNVMTYGYQIFVCQVEEASECFIQNVNRGSTLAVNVTNLKADTKYSFSFVANTSSGLSERSEAVYYSLPTLKNYANATSGLSERSEAVSTSFPRLKCDESSLSVTVVSLAICTLTLFITLVITVIYNKREKLISVVMKKRNITQIAVNSGTEEHEIPDIDPLGVL